MGAFIQGVHLLGGASIKVVLPSRVNRMTCDYENITLPHTSNAIVVRV